MGRKLDALLGRSAYKTSKLKPLLSLALSRLVVLKNQRQVRCSQARSDVVQLLQQAHQERALLRVELVIKEQNMLDVFVMIERYCNLVLERVHLIEQERACPDELKEATSSLLYAASRCGDFPELQEIRTVLTARFGKEFAARAIEVRNNCGVNVTMMQKLSTRMPVLESRMKVLKEIAAENSIVLQLEETTSVSNEDKLDVNEKQNLPSASSSGTGSADNLQACAEETDKEDRFSGSIKTRKYKDVADAAQAAFESAAHAAAAARAAVELSRSESLDPDDKNSPGSKRGRSSDRFESFKTESESQNEQNQGEALKRSTSSSSTDSDGNTFEVTPLSAESIRRAANPLGKDIVFYDSESDIEQSTRHSSRKQIPSRFQSGATGVSGRQSPPRLNVEKGPFNLTTGRVRGY